MIRVEAKVVIPDDRNKDQFYKYLLDKLSEDSESLFWQASLDVVEKERVSLEAVLGQAGFSFLDGLKLIEMTCDFSNEKQAKVAYHFFESLAVAWDIEINMFRGERIFKDIIDLEDLD